MTQSARTKPTRRLHQFARAALGSLPRETRFALYRRMVDCNPAPDPRLRFGIAATEQELEACFSLLHDAYVGSGFMRPDPSGLRVTPYHALPTTTTLYASFDGEVIGTLSIIREGVFGLPLQSVFDLTAVRAQGGRIAEISALAIHPRFRKTGGTILFPLMKFMYEYCTRFFDTRHLVIAVNPRHIEMYESLLFFRRLQEQVVANYDFVNGAPAVGATLDLKAAPEIFRAAYEGRSQQRNLHHYFTKVSLPNIHFPERPYYTTNDPVMSPALLDHFFNQRTQVFSQLDERRRRLLHAIYPEDSYRDVLPPAPEGPSEVTPLRRHRRYSLKCPARLEAVQGDLQSRGAGSDRRLSARLSGACHRSAARADAWHGLRATGGRTRRAGRSRGGAQRRLGGRAVLRLSHRSARSRLAAVHRRPGGARRAAGHCPASASSCRDTRRLVGSRRRDGLTKSGRRREDQRWSKAQSSI